MRGPRYSLVCNKKHSLIPAQTNLLSLAMLVTRVTLHAGYACHSPCWLRVSLSMLVMRVTRHACYYACHSPCWLCVSLAMLVMRVTRHAGYACHSPCWLCVSLAMLVTHFTLHAGYACYSPCWLCVSLSMLVTRVTRHAFSSRTLTSPLICHVNLQFADFHSVVVKNIFIGHYYFYGYCHS